MWLRRLVLYFLILFKESVNGHRVTSLVRYADNVCKYNLSPPMTEDGVVADLSQFIDETSMCKYKFLGILTKTGDLAEVDMMAFNLGYIYGESSYQVGAKLANEIHEKCGKQLTSLKGKPAKEWGPFFKCVSEIIKMDTLQGRGGHANPEETEANRIRNIQISDEEISQIVPKLHCHPLYDTNDSNWKRGEGLRIYAYKFCKYAMNAEKDCMKACMTERLGIVEPTLVDFSHAAWTSRDTMVNRFRNLLQNDDPFKNYKAAQDMADKILGACLNNVPKMPYHRTHCYAQSWQEFLKCINPVWDCDHIKKG